MHLLRQPGMADGSAASCNNPMHLLEQDGVADDPRIKFGVIRPREGGDVRQRSHGP
jgi:hypothetical protein